MTLENQGLDSDLLPVHLDSALYDQLVVDPNTNELYEGEPWIIFFLERRSFHCTKFKPIYERIATHLSDYARFGIVDGIKHDSLSETFQIVKYPTILMIIDKTVYHYVYDGDQEEEPLFKKFIEGGYLKAKKIVPLRPRLDTFAMILVNLNKRMPAINKTLDSYIYERIGLTHINPYQKLSFTVGGGMITIGLSLMVVVYYCFGPLGAHEHQDDSC